MTIEQFLPYLPYTLCFVSGGFTAVEMFLLQRIPKNKQLIKALFWSSVAVMLLAMYAYLQFGVVSVGIPLAYAAIIAYVAGTGATLIAYGVLWSVWLRKRQLI